MEAIQKLNEEIKQQGLTLEPCDFVHRCMENTTPLGDLQIE